MIEPASDNLAHRASLAFAQSFTRPSAKPVKTAAADPFPSSPSTDINHAIIVQRRAAEAYGALARALDEM